MNTARLALLSLLIGVILGGAIALVVAAAYRMRDGAVRRAAQDVPPAARAVLAGLVDTAVIVVATSGVIAAASPDAHARGLREGRQLPSDELLLRARAAWAGTGPDEDAVVQMPGKAWLASAHAHSLGGRLVLLTLHDVTERERTQQLRRDFVANTGHELKTPIGAVSVLAEALEAAPDDPDRVREFAGRIRAAASRLTTVTSRLMTLSRLEADQPLRVRRLSLDDVLDAAVDAHAAQADAAGVAIVRGGERDVHVRGDAQLLGEAIGNLVANAVAYSPAGAHVGIGVQVRDAVVEISVADRGIGISEDDQERVFERFYRADPARSRHTGGSGLGLSIVKHTVLRHGGQVRLWSRPGQGSTFTIRLPLADAGDVDRHREEAA